MAADLDEQVAAFRTRPLGEAGPFTFVAADALTMKVRENGRVVNAVVLVATGVNGDGHREVLGVKVATSETKEAWNVFFADLVARGLSGVLLVTSDAHAGLVEAIAANLPGASLAALPHPLRREPHVASARSPPGPAVKAMLHSVYDQPDADAVHAQYDKLLDAVGRQAARGRRAPRRRPRRRARLHRLPERDLAPGLVEQPQRAAEPGDPPPHRRRRASSPTATPSPASSAPSSPSNTTNGPKAAATSPSTSSPAPARSRRPQPPTPAQPNCPNWSTAA